MDRLHRNYDPWKQWVQFFLPENLNPNFRQGGFRVGIMQFGLGTQNSKKKFQKIKKKKLDLLT